MSLATIQERTAIKALQKMYRAFTGRELPKADARKLLEQSRNE